MREKNEVSLAKAREILDRFEIEIPKATNFFPEYMENVEVIGPGAPPQPVNPNYCLSVLSTLRLMVILADLDPVAYLDPPVVFDSGSPYQYTREVPWLTLSNGAVRNAGLLASYWNTMNGDPNGRYAEDNARADIAWG